MKPALPNYYLKNSEQLGWGEDVAKLDQERLELLNKYVVGKTVLDVGCGYGLYVDYLSSQGYDSFGVDFVKEFISSAQNNKRGTFIVAHAERLPFKNNQIDTVLLFDILEHGDDLEILEEAQRVAKKRVLVIVPKVVDSALEQAGVVFRHYIDKSHLREYEITKLKALAKQTNLKLVEIKPVQPLYNSTIFLELFEGVVVLRKIIRKLVFWLLPQKKYFTEIFAVFEK